MNLHEEFAADSKELSASVPQEEVQGRLSRLVKSYIEGAAKIKALRAQVRDEILKLVDIREKQIPDVLSENGIESMSLTGGLEVSQELAVYVSIKKEQQEEAISWLDAEGHGDIVKLTVTVPFTVRQREEAKKVEELLEGAGYSFSVRGEVHHSTLKAWAKKQIEDGKTLPDSFSVHAPMEAVIKVNGKKVKIKKEREA